VFSTPSLGVSSMLYQSLVQLISGGWMVNIRGVIELDEAPLASEKIEEIVKVTNGEATHIVFLNQGSGGQGIYYPITNQAELELAHDEVEKNTQIIGYDLTISCRARNLNGEVNVEEYANNLVELVNWDIKIQSPTEIVISYVIEGSSKGPGYKFISEVQNHLVSLSIKNKIGFIITNMTWGSKCKGQPFSFTSSDWCNTEKITYEDVQRIVKLKENGNDKLISDLVEFYGQVSPRTKLITGFSILETLFDSEAVHILRASEIDDILFKIKEIPSIALKDSKLKKVTDVLKNPNIMSSEGRNQRIAIKLANVMNIETALAYKKVKDLAKFRGKAAHSITDDKPEYTILSNYIEEVLLIYIYS
jgi:hypothetical protein